VQPDAGDCSSHASRPSPVAATASGRMGGMIGDETL